MWPINLTMDDTNHIINFLPQPGSFTGGSNPANTWLLTGPAIAMALASFMGV